MARDVETALKLIEAGASELAAPTRIGLSTLMLALYYELAVAIRRLLPDISFFEAAAMGELDAVKAVIDRASGMVNAFAPDGFTFLRLAIFFRQPAVAMYLIHAGADVNLPATNARKVAPIHAVCARQDLETLQLLLAGGAPRGEPGCRAGAWLHASKAGNSVGQPGDGSYASSSRCAVGLNQPLLLEPFFSNFSKPSLVQFNFAIEILHGH